MASHVLCCRFRLRLGFFPLGHRCEVASRAEEVQCIECNKWTKFPLSHVLFSYQRWAAIRQDFDYLGSQIAWMFYLFYLHLFAIFSLLCLGPKQTGFKILCHLAFFLIHNFAIEYWNRKESLRLILPGAEGRVTGGSMGNFTLWDPAIANIARGLTVLKMVICQFAMWNYQRVYCF